MEGHGVTSVPLHQHGALHTPAPQRSGLRYWLNSAMTGDVLEDVQAHYSRSSRCLIWCDTTIAGYSLRFCVALLPVPL